ncbi:hypothetical protein V8G54_007889, partial [Vigna mungo]
LKFNLYQYLLPFSLIPFFNIKTDVNIFLLVPLIPFFNIKTDVNMCSIYRHPLMCIYEYALNLSTSVEVQHICRSHDRLAEIYHVKKVVEEVATALRFKEGGWRWARRPKDTIGGVQEVVDLVQRL